MAARSAGLVHSENEMWLTVGYQTERVGEDSIDHLYPHVAQVEKKEIENLGGRGSIEDGLHMWAPSCWKQLDDGPRLTRSSRGWISPLTPISFRPDRGGRQTYTMRVFLERREWRFVQGHADQCQGTNDKRVQLTRLRVKGESLEREYGAKQCDVVSCRAKAEGRLGREGRRKVEREPIGQHWRQEREKGCL